MTAQRRLVGVFVELDAVGADQLADVSWQSRVLIAEIAGRSIPSPE